MSEWFVRGRYIQVYRYVYNEIFIGTSIKESCTMTSYGLMHRRYVIEPEYYSSNSKYAFLKLYTEVRSPPSKIPASSSWLGSPRQTESLYNYKPHHHQLTVVKE